MTMPNNLVAALQRLNGREMLINTETADEFVANLTRFTATERAEAAALEVTSRENLAMVYGIDDDEREGRKPFVYQDGVGVIPVHGTLLNRFNSSWGFVTGYNFIRRQLNLMLDDDDVDSIVFDVNSPGGEAAGCFELAREILASRRVKPSLAMVDSLAASGGIALAVSATRMNAIPSARIGSIGVYRQHVSIEGALKDAGVKVTFAQAGDHKTDGQPYKDLPDSVLRDWTQDVNKTWDDFISLVAECRGLSDDAVRDTQARVYRADEALALGLIDAVKTTTEAVPEFVAEMASDDPDDEEEVNMTDSKSKGAEVTSAVDYDKIGTMISGAVTNAVSALFGAQSRVTAIKDHGKAKGQVALAAKLAANDKISEADAIDLIDAAAGKAAAPKSEKKVKANSKRERVADGDEDEDEDDLDDEDEDEDDDVSQGDDDGEETEESARAARRGNKVNSRRSRDNVNHLDRAMNRSKTSKLGGGDDGGEAPLKGDAAATASLLADYAAHTGTDLRKKPATQH